MYHRLEAIRETVDGLAPGSAAVPVSAPAAQVPAASASAPPVLVAVPVPVAMSMCDSGWFRSRASLVVSRLHARHFVSAAARALKMPLFLVAALTERY